MSDPKELVARLRALRDTVLQHEFPEWDDVYVALDTADEAAYELERLSAPATTGMLGRIAELERERDALVRRNEGYWREFGAETIKGQRETIAALLQDEAKAVASADRLRKAIEEAMKRVNDCADRIANRDDMPYGPRDYNDLRSAIRLAFVELTAALQPEPGTGV